MQLTIHSAFINQSITQVRLHTSVVIALPYRTAPSALAIANYSQGQPPQHYCVPAREENDV